MPPTPPSGTIPFANADRTSTAVAIAGALAEAGVQQITIADPRSCQTQTIHARTTNLPKLLLEAVPGTTFTTVQPGLAMRIDSEQIHFVVTNPRIVLQTVSTPDR